MFHSDFNADNSKFGKELVRVMRKYHITVSSLETCAQMKKEYVCAV